MYFQAWGVFAIPVLVNIFARRVLPAIEVGESPEFDRSISLGITT